MNIAICDDNRAYAKRVKSFISDVLMDEAIEFSIDMYYEKDEFVDELRNQVYYDIVFLDILFPEDIEGGIKVADFIRKELKDESTYIVYMSTEEGNAIKLFDTRPLNFLVKPINKSKIKEIIEYVIKMGDFKKYYFEFSSNREIQRIPVSSILYFKSLGHYIEMICKDEKKFSFIDKLSEVEKRLGNSRFITPHKSYLVNYYAISYWSQKMICLNDGTEIKISRSRMQYMRQMQLLEE